MREDFPVGIGPRMIAFDGENIWVINDGDSTLVKMQPSDGTILGTFPIGDTALDILFDGTNIWVSNFFGDSVMQFRPSDGQLLLTYETNLPVGLAFDGRNILFANFEDNVVTKLRASDGAFRGTYAVGRLPAYLVKANEYLWITHSDDNNVEQLRLRDGVSLGTFSTGFSHKESPLTGQISGLPTRATLRSLCGRPETGASWKQSRRMVFLIASFSLVQGCGSRCTIWVW